MPADLHIHTTASDGTNSPAQVVQLAGELGLDAIAITDHDTVDGVAQAQEKARDWGLEVLTGIEINTDYRDCEMHVLGYFVDTGDHEFRARIGELAAGRARRVERMITRLSSYGLKISMSDVLALAPEASLGRPHVAEVLVRRGIVSDQREAFARYLGHGCVGYVPREKFSPFEAVRLIRLAGGVPVLAHPGLADRDEVIPELVGAGLQGLEVYHPEHGPRQVSRYLALADKHRLVATGGSDYHGYGEHVRLGEVVVSTRVVRELELRRT